ncbi:MAG: ABC transporter ATP-binding protein [Ureaplasma sp.]|nr:ABC transporter ATP-binding protein [Ureaplasma sp.]
MQNKNISDDESIINLDLYWSIGYLFDRNLEINNNLNKNDFLEINNLSVFRKSSKRQTLFDVCFKLYPNSFHIFIGENGAGKSTTIKSIIGQIEDFKGGIYFNSSRKMERNKIFYVQDQQPKFPNVSVFKYLLTLTKLLTKKLESLISLEIDKYLNKYSLEHVRNNNVNKLSAGQKQKILIISSFLVNAPYIILDEPFANLDQTSRYMFMNELKDLSNSGSCIFLSTHIIDEIKDYATHVTFLKKGKVIKSDKVEDPDSIKEFYLSNYINN